MEQISETCNTLKDVQAHTYRKACANNGDLLRGAREHHDATYSDGEWELIRGMV